MIMIEGMIGGMTELPIKERRGIILTKISARYCTLNQRKFIIVSVTYIEKKEKCPCLQGISLNGDHK